MIVGVLAGLVTSNAIEWAAHKYVLHGLGKKKGSYFRFHWREHHNTCRKNNFYDPDYERSALSDTAQGKELGLLLGLAIAVSPVTTVSRAYYGGLLLGGMVYYVIHKKSHLDPKWAKKWLPWHYQHHMGPDQDKNWGVTLPLFDWIMGTREKGFPGHI